MGLYRQAWTQAQTHGVPELHIQMSDIFVGKRAQDLLGGESGTVKSSNLKKRFVEVLKTAIQKSIKRLN